MDTPSADAVSTLLRGGHLASGKVLVGPLGADARRLLRVLWETRGELALRKGADQANVLRRAYRDAVNEGAIAAGDEGGDAPLSADPGGSPSGDAPRPGVSARDDVPGWRLIRLRCKSIRGVAAIGDVFEFRLDGESHLLFGPNGSGKSSLLNAIGWVLSGSIATDCEEVAPEVALYRRARGDDRGAKLRDWPVVHTLPHDADPRATALDCWAEIALRSGDGTETLHLRREYGGSLLESGDGESWRPCPSLSPHGIGALDLQLSVSAATVFGRRSVEAAPDTRSLLSMMLGYDTLEGLDTLVANLAANVTKAANGEADNLAHSRERCREALAALPGRLRDEHPLRDALVELIGEGLPGREAVAALRQEASDRVGEMETELSQILGVGDASGPLAGLADALTAAVVALGRPWTELFPSLASLWRVAREADSSPAGPGRLAGISRELAAFEARATERIEGRLALWREEMSRDGRFRLMIRVAEHYDPGRAHCPVCDQPISGSEAEATLRRLHDVPPDLLADLRGFFGGLREELDQIVPVPVISLKSPSPAARLREDWGRLKASIGRLLGPVVDRHEPGVEGLAETIGPSGDSEGTRAMPQDADVRFSASAAEFLSKLNAARCGLATARWAIEHVPPLIEALAGILTAEGDVGPPSLASELARGKCAAADVTPASALRDGLGSILESLETIEAARSDVQVLEAIRAALEELKPIGKFAEAEVGQIFGQIEQATNENFRGLYPYTSPNLAPRRLHLNRGRNKTIEAYLGCADFEVAGQHIANAGLLRALALSFYFALLGRHPGGLGFILMDDPILSLDDDHREAWAANVLRPALSDTQVIVATHQRQFLNNCRSDFRPGRLVELNPRGRDRRITFRPGDRLDRAEAMLDAAPSSAPTEMRKYREDLLITLDSYSTSPFYDPKNVADSIAAYESLAAPNRLAHQNQAKLAARLKDPQVARVLNAGSHAKTEGDVTAPMIHACLGILREADAIFRREIDRLDTLRLRDLQARAITDGEGPTLESVAEPVALSLRRALERIPRERLCVGDDAASWDAPLALRVIGTAAAKARGCVVDLQEEDRGFDVPPGGAVLVASEVLLPLARPGQWALLAREDEEVADGDLAALVDRGGNRYLRRIWSAGTDWILESINPLCNLAPAVVRKGESRARKVVGVSYRPRKEPVPGGGRGAGEWHPRRDFAASALAGLCGVAVRGTSLEPLASDGQVVLVDRRIDGGSGALRAGGLAVVETDDGDVGNVIKRVFPGDASWLLLSPNAIEPHDPLSVPVASVRAVRPVRGVWFPAT